ncbi:MAG: hypothetical protein C4581_08275 [Nitrospiraceae bacterium]|nr:MAG: hypothetical protein C4581_08275 [Nitrospiraceae bacterium]
MKRGEKIYALVIAIAFCLLATRAYSANDYPHFGINNLGCDSCHFVYGSQPSLLPPWTEHVPQDIDDTQFNTLCWSCHNDIDAPYVKTHSSLQIDNSYGDWTVECRVCHNPHFQKQFRTFGTSSYLYSGVSTGITATALTKTGAGWTVDTYQGHVLYPNILQKNYNYQILNNTSDTITVQGPMNLAKAGVGNTFAIVHGNPVNDTINLSRITIIPSKSGSRTVRFFGQTGSKSFADGDATYDGICEVCHTQTIHFRNDGSGSDQLHTNMGSIPGTNCTDCHKHVNGFQGMGGGAHTTHVLKGYGPQLACTACHGSIPVLADGQPLATTIVCNNCHSASGAVTAKSYWDTAGSSEGEAGSWAAVTSEIIYCGSCHDSTPGNTKKDGTGDTAPNVMGNGTTFGYSITGHGKVSGNYLRLSWQATSDTGNPAANRQCSACHDLSTTHFNNAADRLKTGYANDASNGNCKQCHNPGTVATANPQWYTTYTDYQDSAHYATGNLKCTACHDVHGASGTNIGMTKLNQEALCNQGNCHSGIGGHPGVGSTSFTVNSKNYTLECISCHNVHLVTGTYAQAASNKSPVTMFTNNTSVWGDDWNEKMDFYAGGGTYRTPTGESFTGAQLPDYASFCTDCHGQGGATNVPFGINWGSDPHGKGSANEPNGGGTCPNWYACGLATGWSGDDCTGTDSQCWPVITRGKGDQLFSRTPYNHEERIAGSNFVLSCTDCHTGHGSGNLGRSNVNGGSFSGTWNSMCNNCHYYYSDWHAGMSCGNASCHVSARMSAPGVGAASTPHQMANASGAGGTRTFDQDLVLNMRFENNLNDSGSWRLHSKWMDDIAGSYAAGKSGQAVVLSSGKNIQLGTTNAYWANDDGKHGTWKYFQMKYNTTIEAWVYPTDNAQNEYSVFTQHVGYGSGGYNFALRKFNSTLRCVFNIYADNNGFSQDGRAGTRGAYSSVAIPLNTWTHVAATFDASGPDKNPSDLSIGRIRIYVNGEDVTTSKLVGTDSQPGAGETSIFNYSENSPWNQSICYNGTWCATDYSIGGFYGWQDEFIGRMDEFKVWNITKNAAYFSSYDSLAGPYISFVEGTIGSDQLTVTFSEGVYTNTGSSGALVAGDFTFTDADNGRTITNVIHTAGSSTAVLTLSSALDDTNDLGVDTLAATSNQIFDDYNNAAPATTVTTAMTSSCPTGLVTLNLNEASGSAYVLDSQTLLSGKVNGGAAALTGSAYSGDGSSRYIDFENNDTCLQATTAMTFEARIKPAGIPGDGTNYIRRVLARDGGGNYQISLWCNNGTTEEDPPNNVVMVAFWVKPVNTNGGNAWKVALTDFAACPIVNDKWYKIKAVWNSGVIGGMPASIYVDDQGVNGDDVGQSWAGYINCTDSDQSQMPAVSEIWEGDVISPMDGDFVIGANVSNHANNLFNGLIDWITWKDAVE